MYRFASSLFACGLLIQSSLLGAERQTKPVDPNVIIIPTISLDGADIYAVQEELNRRVPDILFNLEFDQRDAAEITLYATDIPLRRLLDDISRTFHSKWTFDVDNRSINILPADTKRYEYYPFELTIPSIPLKGQTKHEVFSHLLGSPLLKDKSFVIVYDFNLKAFRRDEELHGTLEEMSLRRALNWLCANSGGRHCWRLTYTKDHFSVFYFIPKVVIDHSATPSKQ